MTRFCAGQCGREIKESMGSVKAGDWDEFNMGVREAKDVRELCGACSERFQWAEDGTLESRPHWTTDGMSSL